MKVTATDNASASVSDTFALTVTNTNDTPTVSNAISDQSTAEDAAFSFQVASNTFDDVDSGDTLTYAATLSNGNALPSWLTFNAATHTFSGTPANSDVGAIDVKVTATDNASGAVSAYFSIDVLPMIESELSNIQKNTSQQGFVINGLNSTETAGQSVRGIGDVNGDGLDDVIIGASRSHHNGINSGSSFVVFGRNDGNAVELSDIENGSGGFMIIGGAARDGSGSSVSGAGDVNGDGLIDVIVGAVGDQPNGEYSGASYVVFGKSDGNKVELADVELGIGGFVINGISEGDRTGISVSNAGDVNGDGLDDLIIGADNDDPNGPNSGASFVVFGKTTGTQVNLSQVVSGAGGFVINGENSYDWAGGWVSAAGDINGDGYDDIIVNAKGFDSSSRYYGSSYVIYGKADGSSVELSNIRAGNGGFAIIGSDNQSGYVSVINGGGDINGDGYLDFVLGAQGGNQNGVYSGTTYVVFGSSIMNNVYLSDITSGTGGYSINGVSAGDSAGKSVDIIGDINGDGYDDIVIGAHHNNTNGDDAGAAYIVYGKQDTSTVELSNITDGNGGFVLNGVAAGDQTGLSVAGAGDVNGDGFDDVIIGAPYNDNTDTSAGAAFIVYGNNFTSAVSLVGSENNEILLGTSDNDVIFAASGNDEINGSAGTDRFSGGAGADIFKFDANDGVTTIIDFNRSEGDKIDISTFGLVDFTSLQSLISAHGHANRDTKITLDSDTILYLEDIIASDLVNYDFII